MSFKFVPAPLLPPDAVLDWLFVGTYEHAREKDMLDSLDIVYVLDVESGGSKPAHLDAKCYLARPMCDFGNTVVHEIVNDCIEFIELAKRNESKILVQCEWGINRSVTITVCYLMKVEQMSLRDALKLCFEKRSVARPRDKYIQQLQVLEREWHADADEDEYLNMSEVRAIFNEPPRQ